ncbi:MAG: beta-phosphoglucomutase [Parasporobacterium sp.]|nr:beta-phosphoglucomutase [Parasporobacterium sp.]
MIKAVIFDLEGVICFTDKYHYKAWKELAHSLNVPFDREFSERLRGISRMDSLNIILEQYSGPALSEAEKEELANEKNENYRNLLNEMTPDDIEEGVKDTLEALKQMGYKLAIGSSSRNVPVILDRLGLNGYFNAISDGNNIARSKPDPEVFEKAARYLCLEPSECLVVEDALSGVEAAHAAGMKAACLGDASRMGAGDYNMASIPELLDIVRK